MNRFARLAVGLTLLTGACSTTDAQTVPTLDLTTTTTAPTTTEAPTTTMPVTTTAPPTTEAPTTTSSVPTEKFDPDTAQAEIAALLEEFTEYWTFDNETPDPNDPRLDQIFIGDQRDRIRTLFEETVAKGQVADGTTTMRPYFPALLTASNQTALIGACRLGQVALIAADGSVVIPADLESFEHSFEFTYTAGGWKIAAYGKSDGRDIPCDI